MPDYTPVNADNGAVTLTAGAAVTGGLLVAVSADNSVILTSATTNRAIGVAAHDAPSGGRVAMYPLSGYVHEIPVAAGQQIVAGGPVICSTTPGRIDSTTGGVLSSAASGGLVLGICTRGTTGTVLGDQKARFIGW